MPCWRAARPMHPSGLGTFVHSRRLTGTAYMEEEETMDGLIYLIGLIVVIMAILSFFGLR
jgi:predicted membrane channel-forming protein YqfA (hemolysin III family)